MKKKVLSLFVALAIVVLNFGTYASAATLGDLQHDNISPMGAICSYCSTGTVITTTQLVSTVFERLEICTTRPDCAVTVMRNNYATTTKCNNCLIGTTSNYYTLSRSHSKSH
jgi:hypothetical protein